MRSLTGSAEVTPGIRPSTHYHFFDGRKGQCPAGTDPSTFSPQPTDHTDDLTRTNFAMIEVFYAHGRGDMDMGIAMTRPAFADILDLSAPFQPIADTNPYADDITVPAEQQASEVEKFIARRKKKRKAR